jgi:hypothetical protein
VLILPLLFFAFLRYVAAWDSDGFIYGADLLYLYLAWGNTAYYLGGIYCSSLLVRFLLFKRPLCGFAEKGLIFILIMLISFLYWDLIGFTHGFHFRLDFYIQWLIRYSTYLEYKNFLGQLLKIFFIIAIMLIVFAVIGCPKIRRRKKGSLSTASFTGLIFIVTLYLFFFNGGYIYVIPYDASLAVGNDFPAEKKKALASYAKFRHIAYGDASKRPKVKYSLTYENFLTLVTLSPADFHPKKRYLHLEYWENKVFLPLKEDLEVYQYWGPRFILLQKDIQDLYWKEGSQIPKSIYWAGVYEALWQAVLDGVPDVPYKQSSAEFLYPFVEEYHYDLIGNNPIGNRKRIMFPNYFTNDEREAWLEAYLDLLEKNNLKELADDIRNNENKLKQGN